MKRKRLLSTACPQRRRGATLVEGAIVLSLLTMMMFFILNMGLATCRYNLLRCAADTLLREAIVRGRMSTPEKNSWGPQAVICSAADGSEIAQFLAPWAPTMPAEDVAIEVVWLDGDNRPGDRIRVRVRYPHKTLVPFANLAGAYDLEATATARIMH